MLELTFDAIGTPWVIQIRTQLTDTDFNILRRNISRIIESFDRVYSRFRSDSLVTEMSTRAGTFALPETAPKLFGFYQQLYHLSNGLVTPLIGQSLADAGYDATYSFTEKTMHATPRWEDTFEYSNRAITLKHPALLDFGAAGKGYLVDLIGKCIEKAGVTAFSINASGDILHHAPTGAHLQVGLENPRDASQVIGIATLENGSLCASSGSKRKWGKYNHILNPQTLRSPEEIIATWVIADEAMVADGLATALFFVNPQTLGEAFSFSYATLDKDMSIQHSVNFPVKLFGAE